MVEFDNAPADAVTRIDATTAPDDLLERLRSSDFVNDHDTTDTEGTDDRGSQARSRPGLTSPPPEFG